MTKGYKYYSIGELSEISGATIRTLQYYDQIGLLEAKRNESNLRYYTEKDLILLQQILFHKRVVDQLNLTLQRGVITGFLGSNGAGKSTTMKMMISLVHPTTGQVLIEREEYRNLKEPLKKIGALIDPSALDENLTGRQHLAFIATAAGIDLSRVDEMISMAGLEEVKNKKIKSFSLGMKQR